MPRKPSEGVTPELELVRYQTPECVIDFIFDGADETTIWATQQQMADLFGVSQQNISAHLVNLFRSGQLDENSVHKNFLLTATDGKSYNYQQYSLGAIIAVGFRVNGKRAEAFRQWSTKIITDYVVKGFALNKQRLINDPDAAYRLAEETRAIRTSEKSYYYRVREIVKRHAIDYDPNSQETRFFFARLQNKFCNAATGMISAEILLARADHKEPRMGLRTTEGPEPVKKEVVVAKNYLDPSELSDEMLVSEQFLMFIEGYVRRGKAFTMQGLIEKLDTLLEAQEYSVLPDNYKRGSRIAERANKYAVNQYMLYCRDLPRTKRRRKA